MNRTFGIAFKKVERTFEIFYLTLVVIFYYYYSRIIESLFHPDYSQRHLRSYFVSFEGKRKRSGKEACKTRTSFWPTPTNDRSLSIWSKCYETFLSSFLSYSMVAWLGFLPPLYNRQMHLNEYYKESRTMKSKENFQDWKANEIVKTRCLCWKLSRKC